MTAPDASETLLNAIDTLAPVIRHHADDAERHRRLALPVVRALTEAGIFRMCVPRALGGLEVPPLTFYRVVEAVARLDGSTGWCTFIGGSDGLVGASLAPHTAEEIFGRDPRVVLAGSVAPAGTATVVEGGYRVSGRWPYASGCQHCTWLLGGCHVLDGDQPLSSAKTRSVYDFSVIDQPDRPWTLSTSTNELTLDMTCTSP